MFTFHKLTKDQYEKVVKENNISNTIFMITDTKEICVYNNSQLEICENISKLLTRLPELNNIYNLYKSIEETNNNIIQLKNKKISQNDIKTIQKDEKDFDLNNLKIEAKKQQDINHKEINSNKEDKNIAIKYTPQTEAVKWFKDKTNLFNFNDESFSNNLGIQ